MITRVARTLVDINVQTERGFPQFVDPNDRYSLSMSPALTIVLANLLNTKAEISWDWKGLEMLVVLGELKRLVATTSETPRHLDRLVVELQSGLPIPSAKYKLSVPVVSRCTVVRNGPTASYADVIAPYRLVQVKYSSIPDVYNVNLNDELDKMGLTRSKSFKLQQAVTKILYTMWERLDDLPDPITHMSISSYGNMTHRSEYYPYSSLNVNRVVEKPVTVDGSLRQENAEISVELTKEGEALMKGPMICEFRSESPVTAVFVTNCRKLRLFYGEESNHSDFVVDSKDVDWQGILIGASLPDAVKQMLLDHVDMRFIFL
jgi:hypothetical protein